MTRLTLLASALLASPLLMAGCASSEPPSRADRFADAVFTRLDTDDDGVVEPRELDDARARQFARADLNGDGYIAGAEFEELRADRPDQGGRRGRRGGGGDPVARMDRDGDGRVSRLEFRGTTDLLERADFDGDGSITRREFETAAERMGRRR